MVLLSADLNFLHVFSQIIFFLKKLNKFQFAVTGCSLWMYHAWDHSTPISQNWCAVDIRLTLTGPSAFMTLGH